MDFDNIVKEMITQYGSRNNGDDYIIGFEGKVWRINENTPKRILNSIAKMIGWTGTRSWDDSSGLYDALEEERPDVFTGQIVGDSLQIRTDRYGHQFTSKMVRKIMDHYGLESFELGENDGWQHGKYYNKASVGKIDYDRVYHGTYLKVMPRIMVQGLSPVQAGNWGDLKFSDRIFLTSKFTEACFHASRAATRHNSYPIVLGMSIPDKDLIVPDFDMVRMFGRTDLADKHGYTNTIKDMPRVDLYGTEKSKIRDINSTTGIFAYKGRIPYKFIHSLYYFEGEFGTDDELDYDSESFSTLTKANLPEYMSQMDEYGMFFGIGQRPQYEEDEEN